MPIAAHESRAPIHEKLHDLLIVDMDVHVHESPRALEPYCDMPWRVALGNIRRRARVLPRHPGLLPGRVRRQLTRRSFPPPTRVRAWFTRASRCAPSSTRLHIDLGVLFPDHLLKLAVLTQTDYAAALARAYNAWLVECWTSRSTRRCSARSSPVRRTRTTRPARSSDTPADPRGRCLPAVRRSRPAVGQPPLRPDLRGSGDRRPSGVCCTASPSRTRCSPSTTTASTPSSRVTRRQPHLLDHRQPRAHDLDRRRRALPEAADRRSPRRACRGCRS